MALFVISGGHSANLSQSQAWALGTKAREGAEESWERAHPGLLEQGLLSPLSAPGPP